MAGNKHKQVRGIDLMKKISEKQAEDLQKVISDNDRRLKKSHKYPVM